MVKAVVQTEGRVWDLLNAGPLHRFVAEGLIVSNCLLLDFGGNVLRHGPINDVTLSPPGKGEPGKKIEPPPKLKECPDCHEFVAVSVPACICGHQFPAPALPNHDAFAVTGVEIIRTKDGEKTGKERWQVKSATANYHPPKPGKRPTLRVVYRCHAGRTASQFLCFEHPPDTYARLKAERWWRRVTGADESSPVPTRVGEVARLLREGAAVKRPVEITVRVGGAWPDVLRTKYVDIAPQPLAP